MSNTKESVTQNEELEAQVVLHLEEDDHEELGARFNGRISYICTLSALVIGIVVLATAAVGDLDLYRAILGLACSVVLLALADLQQYRDNRRKPRP